MQEEIVGLSAELESAQVFLDRLTPGIGKTTLWLQGVRAAERRGYRVLQARPAESEQLAALSF